MDREKLIMYPYDNEFASILRHSNLLGKYEIMGLVSPGGWGLNGRDAGEADYGSKLGITVTNDFDESIKLCDTVLFSDSRKQMDFEKFIMPKVIKSIGMGKNIIFTIPLTNDTFDKIEKECLNGGVYFKYFNNLCRQDESQEVAREFNFLYDIHTPVIFVLGIGDKANKFEVQLALRENVMKMGYRVSQIGTRGYCELLGFHSFPQFMYSPNLSESSKIILFNQFIKKLENENPDVIIIGIPGGILPFSNKLTNNFGIVAYEASQAVAPDSAIFSCYYAEYYNEYFVKMVDTVRYRLGCKVDCFNMANSELDWLNSKDQNKMIYTSLDSKFVDEKIKKYKGLDTPVFNVLNSKGASGMTEYVINRLSDYGKTESI